jgi:Protein of unknown function (DUF3102)
MMEPQSEMCSGKPLSTGSEDAPATSSYVIQPSEIDRPSAVSKELESAAQRVRTRLKNMSEDIIEIGRELRAVKRRLKHGHFLDWVEKECELSRRTAQLMMRAAEWAEAKCEIVAHLEPAAIYLLAAPSTPETVRQEVLSRLEEGQKPATQRVKDMIRATKEKRPPTRQKVGQPHRDEQSEGGQSDLTENEPFEGQHIELRHPLEEQAQYVDEAEIEPPRQGDSPPQKACLQGAPSLDRCRNYPDMDPLAAKDPPWINGALQLIPLVVEAIRLCEVPNREAIIRGSLQMIPPLVEAVLELDEIPKRSSIGALLRYCGYNDFADRIAVKIGA